MSNNVFAIFPGVDWQRRCESFHLPITCAPARADPQSCDQMDPIYFRPDFRVRFSEYAGRAFCRPAAPEIAALHLDLFSASRESFDWRGERLVVWYSYV